MSFYAHSSGLHALKARAINVYGKVMSHKLHCNLTDCMTIVMAIYCF